MHASVRWERKKEKNHTYTHWLAPLLQGFLKRMGEEIASETQETVDTLPVPKPEEAVKREGKYFPPRPIFSPPKVFNIFINQGYHFYQIE